MQRLHLILGSTGGLLLLGWVALVALPEAGEDGVPAVGQLADWDSTLATSWTAVASLPSELAGDEVTALDARADTVFVMQRHQWMALAGSEQWGPFGSRAVGAPDYIAAGQGIVRLDDGVLVLDGTRQMASLWSFDGVRGAEVNLRSTEAAYSSPTTLVAHGPRAAVVGVLALTDGGTQWSLLRVRGSPAGRTDTLLQDAAVRHPGAAWDFPLVARRADGAIGILGADSWRLRVLGDDGQLLLDTLRAGAPRWAGDRAARQRLLEMASQAPSVMREAFAPREHTVPGRALTATSDGGWLAVTADNQERHHAELLDARGHPIARLWREAEPHPVFAVRGALYRVRALDDRTVIDRQEIRRP